MLVEKMNTESTLFYHSKNKDSISIESLFMDLIKKNKIEDILSYAQKNKIDYKFQGKSGQSFLHAAVLSENLEVCRFLLEKDIDINQLNENGLPPLQLAIRLNHIVIIRLLILAGARLDKLKHLSFTLPLHQAVLDDNVALAELLIIAGADIHIPFKYLEESLLHVAIKKNNLKMATLLIKKGANILAKNAEGLSVLNIARQKGNLEIINLVSRALEG